MPAISSIGTIVSGTILALRAAVKKRADARRRRDQFAAMDDRLLRDIGLSEADIAALRAGDALTSFQR